MALDFIERRIIIGLIVSDEYAHRVSSFWKDELLTSPELRKVARWCLNHYDKYQKAPGKDIESIYMDELRSDRLSKAEAELIENILDRISDEYERAGSFNSEYLYDQSVSYFREIELKNHTETVQDLIERGQTEEAQRLATSFVPSSFATSRGLEVGSKEGYERIRAAFTKTSTPVVKYVGALGEMLNPHLVRDGFIAFMAPEKRGKTWWMTDICFRALRQGSNVAFFQAGDLSESQMLRRLAIYAARRSDDPQYCEEYWRPVGDCLYNQFNVCTRPDRNCDRGIYDADLRKMERGFTPALPFDEDPDSYEDFDALVRLAEQETEYRPCDSATCTIRRPAVWLEKQPEKVPLDGDAAAHQVKRFFDRYKRRFRLATYPNDTLTTEEMMSCLDEWERQDDFVPDAIGVDYSDIMAAPRITEHRHKQDAIWKGLRAVSQKRHALVFTATQTDAASYRSRSLSLSNFSEDKRKYGHVTAMFGLNQDPQDREKKIGILRVNVLVAREGAYSKTQEATVLQDIRSGRPVLESYFTKKAYAS